ncbi:MAG: oxidoreductase [Flavobacteriaceae bacterium]|nr:oxidoreductase [Flavobacteriaceae bacterium]
MYYKIFFKYFFLIIVSVYFFTSCQTIISDINLSFSKVDISHILLDSTLNIRALEIQDKKVYNATSKGEIYSFDTNKPDLINVDQYSSQIDSVLYPNFRSLSIVNQDVFTITIGNPALLFKNGKVVYKEENEKVFYDSMDFWNDKEGLVVGDSMDGCISILITRDGGESWKKLDCSIFNKRLPNEGFFAASDTNISIVGNRAWIASGGINSRIYYSEDIGKSWKIIETPIIQGESTKGIFSIDFYDNKNGFAIGGDYTKPLENISNKIITNDSGKTWKTIANNQNPGYRSCVQYFPNSKGKSLVAVGFDGIDVSNDGGYSWKHISDEGYYTLRFLNDCTAYAAGNGKISKLHFK